MFKVIVVITCLHCAFARPQGDYFEKTSTTPASILEYTVADDGAGNFNFAYKSSDGISEQAEGHLKDILVPKYDEDGRRVGDEQAKGLVQKGTYSYTAPDGQVIKVISFKIN